MAAGLSFSDGRRDLFTQAESQRLDSWHDHGFGATGE